jgi:NAD(P)-dependent dehydrogenase (short-subunit alcohol dehydrogenase family)
VTQVALITGGSRGIGAATALAAARAGFSVAIVYREREAAAERIAGDCRGIGVDATAIRADVTAAEDIERAFAEAAALGPITAVVNNAGVTAPATTVAEMSTPRIETMLRTNVLSVFLCCRAAVRRMSTARGGSGGAIVNISSKAAALGAPGEYVDYAASKAAIDALTVGLAKEVAREGIRVNSVRPGLIRTEIHATTGDPSRVDRLAPGVPMGRAGEPEEVAAAIVWLLTAQASFVTGAILDVTGGR